MRSIRELIRDNIRDIKPYASAREEFNGLAEVYLDANENPFPSDFNRYPDPLQKKLKKALAKIKGTKTNQIFLSNGSDEAIDWMVRAFCEPKQDAIIYNPPTFGMYKVVAAINDVEIIAVPMNADFEIPVEKTLAQKGKILFICNPNNPTGNQQAKGTIIQLIENFDGIVVVDEAYGDFADYSLIEKINQYPNLVIMQTFSKAWGLAGLRLGMTFANPEIIDYLTKLKMPYNVNSYTQKEAIKSLSSTKKDEEVALILKEKKALKEALNQLEIVEKIFPSAANFFLVRFKEAEKVYQKLAEKKLLVRNQSYQINCKNTLRITVGTPKENQRLLSELKKMS